MLVLFQPAGSMEDFFLQMSKLGKEIPKTRRPPFSVYGKNMEWRS
jgi:hypothetical protein